MTKKAVFFMVFGRCMLSLKELKGMWGNHVTWVRNYQTELLLFSLPLFRPPPLLVGLFASVSILIGEMISFMIVVCDVGSSPESNDVSNLIKEVGGIVSSLGFSS